MTTLFAAFNTADATVICAVHRRHRTNKFKKIQTQVIFVYIGPVW